MAGVCGHTPLDVNNDNIANHGRSKSKRVISSAMNVWCRIFRTSTSCFQSLWNGQNGPRMHKFRHYSVPDSQIRYVSNLYYEVRVRTISSYPDISIFCIHAQTLTLRPAPPLLGGFAPPFWSIPSWRGPSTSVPYLTSRPPGKYS